MTKKNQNLTKAKSAKNDEFYTQLTDIEKELIHYRCHFKNKVVYCNCDDPRASNFFFYFSHNFEKLGLKKLIATCYKNKDRDLHSQNDSEQAVYLEYYGDKNGNRVPDPDEIGIHKLKGDGDFRSAECIAILKQADIVVTNPPFSLFREYVAQLMEYKKKFLIMGNLNAVTYKEIFPLIKDNKTWLGYGFQAGNAFFETPHHKEFARGVYNKETGLVKFRNIAWYTNLSIPKRNRELALYESYDQEKYPKYDNYDAIEVSKIKNIPKDYYEVMGVPITYVEKHNPKQFEIIGLARYVDNNPNYGKRFTINNKEIYARILIKRISS